MNNRTLAFATSVAMLSLVLLSGNHNSDAQSQPAPKPNGQNNFIEVGKYLMNRDMISYIEKRENGFLQIHVHGQTEVAAVVSGEQAKSFLRTIKGDGH